MNLGYVAQQDDISLSPSHPHHRHRHHHLLHRHRHRHLHSRIPAIPSSEIGNQQLETKETFMHDAVFRIRTEMI
jgi:hypothetical protein